MKKTIVVLFLLIPSLLVSSCFGGCHGNFTSGQQINNSYYDGLLNIDFETYEKMIRNEESFVFLKIPSQKEQDYIDIMDAATSGVCLNEEDLVCDLDFTKRVPIFYGENYQSDFVNTKFSQNDAVISIYKLGTETSAVKLEQLTSLSINDTKNNFRELLYSRVSLETKSNLSNSDLKLSSGGGDNNKLDFNYNDKRYDEIHTMLENNESFILLSTSYIEEPQDYYAFAHSLNPSLKGEGEYENMEQDPNEMDSVYNICNQDSLYANTFCDMQKGELEDLGSNNNFDFYSIDISDWRHEDYIAKQLAFLFSPQIVIIEDGNFHTIIPPLTTPNYIENIFKMNGLIS